MGCVLQKLPFLLWLLLFLHVLQLILGYLQRYFVLHSKIQIFPGLEEGSGEGSGSGDEEDDNQTSYNGYDDNGKIKDAIEDYGDDALQIQGGSLKAEGSVEEEWSLSDHFANLDSIKKAKQKINDELRNIKIDEEFAINNIFSTPFRTCNFSYNKL